VVQFFLSIRVMYKAPSPSAQSKKPPISAPIPLFPANVPPTQSNAPDRTTIAAAIDFMFPFGCSATPRGGLGLRRTIRIRIRNDGKNSSGSAANRGDLLCRPASAFEFSQKRIERLDGPLRIQARADAPFDRFIDVQLAHAEQFITSAKKKPAGQGSRTGRTVNRVLISGR
jgi:hypothetical protein